MILDGTNCGGRIFYEGTPGIPATTQMSTVATSMMTEKPFLFSPLELTGAQLKLKILIYPTYFLFTDDDSYLESQGMTAKLGEVTIEIWRVAIGDVATTYNVPLPEQQKIHERSKKALAHRVK